MKRFTVFNLMGLVLLVMMIRLGCLSIRDYWTDTTHLDWPETRALVTAVDSWEERVVSGRKGNRRTRYETLYSVTYEYQIDGITYTEHLDRSRTPYTQGSEIPIRYDPAAHNISTVRVQPSLYNLIVELVACLLFGSLGFLLSGLWRLVCRKS